jgi:hypothetical protein
VEGHKAEGVEGSAGALDMPRRARMKFRVFFFRVRISHFHIPPP